MDITKCYKDYIEKYSSVLRAVKSFEIEQTTEVLKRALENKNNIYVCGNGGSGGNAAHAVNDLSLCKGKHSEFRFNMRSLCDNITSILAIANDVEFDDIFVCQLKGILKPNDIVLGISGSGNSQNVVRALNYANEKEAISVALVAYDGGEMKKVAKHSIHIPTFDMQKAEDAHMLLFHIWMQYFAKEEV